MWTRLRLALTRVLWETTWAVGTPAVSLPLAGLAATYAAAAYFWHALRPGEPALEATWAYAGLSAAMVLDAAVSVVRAAPFAQREDGRIERAPLTSGRAQALLARLGWLAAALGFAASVAGRDRLEFRVARGERFSGAPQQLVDPDAARTRSPVQVDLEIVEVEGDPGAPDGPVRVLLRGTSGGLRAATRRMPALVGWDTYLRPHRVGETIRYEILSAGDAPVEAGFAKVDLAHEGDVIRAEAVPLRILVRAVGTEPPIPGKPPALDAAVYRGKLLLDRRVFREGAGVELESLRLRFPEWRPWVEIELVRDPGLPLFALALVSLVGAAAVAASRRIAAARTRGGTRAR